MRAIKALFLGVFSDEKLMCNASEGVVMQLRNVCHVVLKRSPVEKIWVG